MKNKGIPSIMGWVIVTIFRLGIGIGGWYALSSYRLEQRANREYYKLEEYIRQLALTQDPENIKELKGEVESFLAEYGEVLDREKKQGLYFIVEWFGRLDLLLREMKSLDVSFLDPALYYSRVAVEGKISSVKKVIAWKENLVGLISEFIERVDRSKSKYASERLEGFENRKLLFDEIEKQKKLELEIYQFVLDKQGQFEVKNGQVLWYKQRDLNHIKKLVKDLKEQESRLEKIGEEVKRKARILHEREIERLERRAERE